MSRDSITLRILDRKEIEDLLENTPTEKRCEHLRTYSRRPYCGKDFKGKITDERRMLCDAFSLQLYCLGERGKCCIYADRFSLYS